MKLHYILEYVSKKTNKICRSDVGYDLDLIKMICVTHLQNGDFNLAILPVSEDCATDDPDNIEIIDVSCEAKA